jgi:energy-coupling factor transport system permease protein
LTPEIKIVLYVLFVVALFSIGNLTIYLFIFLLVSILLSRLPFRKIISGWLPISLFLVFTFLSNALNREGKIIFSSDAVVLTWEGLNIAAIKTLRVLFMIAGAKILMFGSGPEETVRALGRLLGPLERLGIPVKDFFHAMWLTLKCFPVLKTRTSEIYRKSMACEDIRGFRARTKLLSSFLLPMFVESIREPEVFFGEAKNDDNQAEDPGPA